MCVIGNCFIPHTSDTGRCVVTAAQPVQNSGEEHESNRPAQARGAYENDGLPARGPEHNVTTIMDMLDKVAPARDALTCRNRRASSICAASVAPLPTSGRRWPSACGTTPPTRATPTAPTSPRTWPTPTKRSSPPKAARSRRRRNRTRPPHARHALAVDANGEGNAKPAEARASPATEKTKSFHFLGYFSTS